MRPVICDVMSNLEIVDESVSVSDNAGRSGPTKSELLCFVRDKCNVMTTAHLVKICVDFYREEEVMAARAELDSVLITRLPKRKAPTAREKCRTTLEDIVKACLDPSNTLPVYFAVDLSRLPPVDAKHCDVTAILMELQSLRAEVREFGHLRQEVEELKAELSKVKDSKTPSPNVVSVDHIASVAPGTATGESVTGNDRQMGPSTYVQVAQELQRMGLTAAPRNKTAKKSVVGTSSTSRLKSVQTYRHVDIFVSRLSPHTTEAELANCIEEVKGTVKVHDVTCEKLQSRYEHLYKSYYVSVRVESQDMKSAIDTFMAPDIWPSGVLVRRYFKPKNGSDQ